MVTSCREKYRRRCSHDNMEVGGHRKIGQTLRWSDAIRKCMKEKQVKLEEAHDRITWRLKTRCADPKINREKGEEEEVRSAPTPNREKAEEEEVRSAPTPNREKAKEEEEVMSAQSIKPITF